MEMTFRARVKAWISRASEGLGHFFFEYQRGTDKKDLRFLRLKWIAVSVIVLFVAVVLFMPEESNVPFSRRAEMPAKSDDTAAAAPDNSQPSKSPTSASALWSTSHVNFSGGGSRVNHNTSMIISPKGGNAKTQLRAGFRLPIRILDKFTVSQEQVPILAELILDSVSESGLKLPAGTRLYGEASFQKGSDRASIQFKQLSLPDGQIRPIAGMAARKDGQVGISGRIFSDGMKNTAGQLLTTFVGGLASGSMQTDILGHSRGGLENGLLNAVSQTAQTRAQAYGQKLQTEREWIEVNAGTEADAILSDTINLQTGGDSYEQR